jgi:hypothetical protein
MIRKVETGFRIRLCSNTTLLLFMIVIATAFWPLARKRPPGMAAVSFVELPSANMAAAASHPRRLFYLKILNADCDLQRQNVRAAQKKASSGLPIAVGHC